MVVAARMAVTTLVPASDNGTGLRRSPASAVVRQWAVGRMFKDLSEPVQVIDVHPAGGAGHVRMPQLSVE
jgi:hypothetical protein